MNLEWSSCEWWSQMASFSHQVAKTISVWAQTVRNTAVVWLTGCSWGSKPFCSSLDVMLHRMVLKARWWGVQALRPQVGLHRRFPCYWQNKNAEDQWGTELEVALVDQRESLRAHKGTAIRGTDCLGLPLWDISWMWKPSLLPSPPLPDLINCVELLQFPSICLIRANSLICIDLLSVGCCLQLSHNQCDMKAFHFFT